MEKKKRSEKRQRNDLVQFRLTKEEKQEFLARCKQSGLNGADYFRKTALKSKPLKSGLDTKLLVQLLSSWGKIGSNLNQIAKHYNGGNPTDQAIGQSLIDEVKSIRTDLRKALGYDL